MIIKLKGYVCVVIIACIQISDSIQRNFWHLLVFKSPWPIEAASLIQALLLLYGIYDRVAQKGLASYTPICVQGTGIFLSLTNCSRFSPA